MIDSKKAFGPIGFIFLVLVFVIVWFVWLGGAVGDWGHYIVLTNNYTGLEAFFYENLNMWIFITLILGIMGFFYFGGGE